MDETWNNLDEKAWVEKYATLPQSNFKWEVPCMNNTSCTMFCGGKRWVLFIGIIGYSGYAPI
jgi:hypothetical protein